MYCVPYYKRQKLDPKAATEQQVVNEPFNNEFSQYPESAAGFNHFNQKPLMSESIKPSNLNGEKLIVQELLEQKDDFEFLQGLIMRYASDLGAPDVIKYVRNIHATWLSDALLQIRADSASTNEQRLGLMTCMMALKGPAAAHIHVYICQLPA